MTTNHITLEQARAMSPSELATLSVEDLEYLQAEIEAEKERLKADQDFFIKYMDDRFGTVANGMRLDKGKDTGTVRIRVGAYDIKSDLRKIVEWDQAILSGFADKMRACGERPEDYFEIEYKISEKKYGNLPEEIRNAFGRARTVKTGKPNYKIEHVKETV